MTEHYLEDHVVGQKFDSVRLGIDAARIKSFAAEFDPQPFHLNEEAAKRSILRGLAASGWHTAALTMRPSMRASKPAGGIVGAGCEVLKWPRPVRSGVASTIEFTTGTGHSVGPFLFFAPKELIIDRRDLQSANQMMRAPRVATQCSSSDFLFRIHWISVFGPKARLFLPMTTRDYPLGCPILWTGDPTTWRGRHILQSW
jgi:hypothetical protein